MTTIRSLILAISLLCLHLSLAFGQETATASSNTICRQAGYSQQAIFLCGPIKNMWISRWQGSKRQALTSICQLFGKDVEQPGLRNMPLGILNLNDRPKDQL